LNEPARFSQFRAQLWEFVVEIVDAALWLSGLSPDHTNHIVPPPKRFIVI
jgi:hypothetical protein